MTGNVKEATTQSILYKVGYFIFVAVFLVAILISLDLAILNRDRVRPEHFTVGFDPDQT